MTLPAYQGDVGLCTPCPRCDRRVRETCATT